jgi:preprotein translocase subunit YajC
MNAPILTPELLLARTTLEATETQATTAAPDAEPKAQTSTSLFDNLLVPGAACILVFWFIVIRPEKRQRKAREAMLESLKKGDEVVTSGGIHGKVTHVKDEVITVQVADGVRLRFALSAVQTRAGDEEPAKDSEDKQSTETSKSD